jgi:multiple antibiotic resistance protein
MSIVEKSLTIFLVLDPIGNVGIIAAIINNYSRKEQNKILKRESFIALSIMLLFYFFGIFFLKFLNISQHFMEITSGVILLFFSLKLIYPREYIIYKLNEKKEPFVVPIAMPLIAGPSSLGIIIIFSNTSLEDMYINLFPIIIAWVFATIIILKTPIIINLVNLACIRICEKTMGVACGLIAIQMATSGFLAFFKNISLFI